MKRRLFGKKTYIVFGILCCVVMWLQFGMESYAFTRTTGEVTGSSVKVRKEASTDSEMVASVRAGDDLDVVDSVNGSDGKIWYKIMVSATEYGYIRSDFVSLAGGQQSTDNNTTTGDNTTTEVTPVDEQQGHTSTNNVKVRKQATTNSAEVDRLSQDQLFKITGTAQGPDGKMWYYVSYVDGGASKKGFIRSDLVTIVEKEETEEEPGESNEDVVIPDDDEAKPNIPAPATDYEAVYTTDETGNYVWYLYDKTVGQRYKVDQLLNVSKEKQAEIDQLSSDNFGLKIGLIITICLLVMLGVAIAFYIFKMREEQENAGYRKVSQTNTGKMQGNTRTQSVARGQQNPTRTQSNVRPQTLTKPQTTATATKTTGQTKTQAPTQTPVRATGQTKTQAPVKSQEQKNKLSWKAKNFLEDNDEFEFGFLDFEDDDE